MNTNVEASWQLAEAVTRTATDAAFKAVRKAIRGTLLRGAVDPAAPEETSVPEYYLVTCCRVCGGTESHVPFRSPLDGPAPAGPCPVEELLDWLEGLTEPPSPTPRPGGDRALEPLPKAALEALERFGQDQQPDNPKKERT